MNATLRRLHDAVNRHDPEAMAALFADDYRSEQPVHPAERFTGNDQVATNWRRMFAGVPDLTAELVREADADGTVWSEWNWHGTRTDGTPFHMCGVILLGLHADGAIAWARLYMEPVDEAGPDIDEAVGRLSGAPR